MPICDHCKQDRKLTHRVWSAVIRMTVCADCAREARDLHSGEGALTVEAFPGARVAVMTWSCRRCPARFAEPRAYLAHLQTHS
jgi:hypothetical protein